MSTRYLTSILAAAAASVASVAIAQTSPTSTPTKPATAPDGMQVQSPYWSPDGGNVYYMEQPQFGEGLMEKTVLAVPAARAEAVAAKWQYRRANTNLNNSADMLRRDFNDSEEYAKAVADLKQAYRDLENARLDALKGLRGTSEYEAIESLRKSVNAQIADERDQDEPSLDRLTALAEMKMQAIAPVRAAEQQTIESNANVRSAKDRLVAAANRVAQLEKEFNHGIRDSIELADARKAKEDARIAMLASAAFLDEAREARNIAIKYSYASRGLISIGYPGYGFTNNYGSYGGYGYGYGYGYGGYGGYGGWGSGALAGLGGYRGPAGVIGSSPFGAGTNAIIGGGPGSNPRAQNPGGNAPGANVPFPPFGSNNGRGIPGPFGGSSNNGTPNSR